MNADGRMDLATIASDGSVHLLENKTTTTNKWLRVTLNGRKAMKLAPGAEVEVKSATRYQKQVYRGIPLLFGLRSDARVDTIRITWPNGLILLPWCLPQLISWVNAVMESVMICRALCSAPAGINPVCWRRP